MIRETACRMIPAALIRAIWADIRSSQLIRPSSLGPERGRCFRTSIDLNTASRVPDSQKAAWGQESR